MELNRSTTAAASEDMARSRIPRSRGAGPWHGTYISRRNMRLMMGSIGPYKPPAANGVSVELHGGSDDLEVHTVSAVLE